jgi:hypothetical protein
MYMEERWYKSLVKIVKARLLFYQLNIKKENKHFIIINAGVEDIIIPKKQIANYTVIYFTKDKKVVNKFISDSIWKNTVFKSFLSHYWKRQTENLKTYDNL